jgi:putative membrane protein
MMMGDMGTFGGWAPGFGWVFMLLFWALAVLGVIAIVKWLIGGSNVGEVPPPKTPLQILQERYARGEIDREEFEQKKRDLSG